MECKIDPNEIDREGILSLIKNDCVDCYLKMRMVKQKLYPKITFRCKGCPFISASGERKSAKNYFTTGIACGAKFKPYGIDPDGRLGKAQLFYLLYHPELNWYLPDGSELHHLNKENWNDHVWNLFLCNDSSEHTTIEADQNKKRQLLNEQSYDLLK